VADKSYVGEPFGRRFAFMISGERGDVNFETLVLRHLPKGVFVVGHHVLPERINGDVLACPKAAYCPSDAAIALSGVRGDSAMQR
jgi:hypothetical protein